MFIDELMTISLYEDLPKVIPIFIIDQRMMWDQFHAKGIYRSLEFIEKASHFYFTF